MTGYDREDLAAQTGEWTDVPATWILALAFFGALLLL